jgi:hypothetical protein
MNNNKQGVPEHGSFIGQGACISREQQWLLTCFTLRLLISYIYIYMELLLKPEISSSYIYGPTFGNAQSRLLLFAVKCFNIESMQKVFVCHSCV